MPQPQPRQATCTVGVSVLPPLAHCSNRPCVEMALKGVPECCSLRGSSTYEHEGNGDAART